MTCSEIDIFLSLLNPRVRAGISCTAKFSFIRSPKGDLLALRVHARFCRHRVLAKTATSLYFRTQPNKISSSMDDQLYKNSFYVVIL